MKLLFVIVAACLFTSPASSQISGYANFEIVESIPIETTLDNPGIRNTSEVWLEMINGAKRSLDIEQFYISDQKAEPLEAIISAIIEAGKRGVKVRIVVDARMYKTYPETVDRLGKHANTQTRVIDFGKLMNGVQHAKFFIVDNEQVFFGSQNFDWRALKHIHELGIRLHHPAAVKIYADVFDLDWNLAEKNDPSLIPSLLHQQSYPVPFTVVEAGNDTLIFSPIMSPKGLITDSTLWDERHIVNLIDKAKTDVMCQFLAYSPVNRDKSYYAELDNALRRAAARGVKVKMMVSDWEKDHPAVDHIKSLSLVPNIEVKFSVIPEWSGGYISYARVDHCKFLVVDGGSSWLGTSNWGKRIFL